MKQLVGVSKTYLNYYPDAIFLQKYYALGLVQIVDREEGVQILEQILLNGDDSSLVLDNYIQFNKTVNVQLHQRIFDYLKKINVLDMQLQYADVLIENDYFEKALAVLQMEKKHLHNVIIIKNILLCAFKLDNQKLIQDYIDAEIDFDALSFYEIQDFVTIFIQAGKRDRVLNLILMAESKQEKTNDFVIWYADSLHQIGRTQNGIDALQEVIEDGTPCAEIYILLGELLYASDEKLEGLNAFEMALTAPKINTRLLKSVATFFGEQDDLLNQIRYLKEALKLEADPATYYDLAVAYEAVGNSFEALSAVQLGLGIHSTDVRSLILQSTLLVRLDRPNAALESINKAISLAPQDLTLYKTATEINLALGNFDEAYAALPMLEKLGDVESVELKQQVNFFCLYFDEVLNDDHSGESTTIIDSMRIFSALLLDEDDKVPFILNSYLSNLDTPIDYQALQAIYLAKQGDVSSATLPFKNGLIELEKDSEPSISSINTYLTTVYFGYAAAWLHEWDVALRLFEKAERVYPAVMVQSYLVFLVKMMAQFNTPIYEFCNVKTRLSAMKPFLKSNELEMHRLQSIQLKSVNHQQTNFLFILKALMDGQPKPIESMRHSFEDCAFLIGSKDHSQTKRLLEMKSGSVLAKMIASAVLNADHPDFSDQIVDTMAEALGKNALVNAIFGKRLEKDGNLRDALKIWSSAIEEWDDEPRWLGTYARLLALVGSVDEASSIYEKGLSLDSENIEMTLALGNLHVSKEDHDSASQHYSKAIQKGMNDSKVFAAYSKSLQKIDKPDLAERMAIKAIEQSPQDVNSILNYAELLVDNKAYAKAQIAIKKAKSLDPINLDALNLEINIFEAEGNYEDAIALLNQRQGIKKLSSTMRVRHANLYAKSGNYPNAIAILNTVLQKDTNNTKAAFALFNLYMEMNELEKSIKVGQTALKNASNTLTKDDFVSIYSKLAKTLHSKGQLDQAVHYLNEAITLAPMEASLYFEIATVFVQSRQFDRAINYLREATRLKIHTIEICQLAADLYEKSMDFIHAEEMLKKASELEPKNVEIKRKLKSVIVRKIVHQRGE